MTIITVEYVLYANMYYKLTPFFAPKFLNGYYSTCSIRPPHVRYMDSTCKFSVRLPVSDDDQSWSRIGISPPGAAQIPFRSRYMYLTY